MPSDTALQRNPANGKYNFQWTQNDVAFDDSCEHEVMSRLAEARAKWWADEDGTHGSRIRSITQINSSTATDAEAYAREALQGMVDAKQIAISSVTVSVLPPTIGSRFVVSVFYTAPGSQQTRKTSVVFV